MDRAALWRAEQVGTGSFQGREGIARPWGGHPLADDDGPGPGPGVEHPRIRGLAAVVRGQHQVNWLGLGLGDQLDEPQLIKVARKSGVSSSFLPEKTNRHRISPGFPDTGFPRISWGKPAVRNFRGGRGNP